MNQTAVREALPTDEEIALARLSGEILSNLSIRRNSPQTIDFRDDCGEVHSVCLITVCQFTPETVRFTQQPYSYMK